MSDIKRSLKVFLYHAPSDRNKVRDLYLRLINDGVDAWLIKEKLLPGQDWKHELHNAVREADVVIVCLSKRFDQGESRQKEVRAAFNSAIEELEDEVFIVSVRLEECNQLPNLKNWQRVDLFEEAGYEMLMHALQARADQIGAAIQRKESSLPQITTPSVNLEQHAIPEEKPVEALQGTQAIIEGAGIIIEGPQRRISLYKPERVIIAALLGFAVLMMMILFGPAWIEKSYQVALTAGLETTQTSPFGTKKSPLGNPPLTAIPTLRGTGDVSHIVFLIDTTSSMQGRRIRMVKSVVSEFISRLGDQYLVSVMEFDTNVELRMGVTADHAAASEAVNSIIIDVAQDSICLRDALYAGIQETSLTPITEDTKKNMIIVLTDAGRDETSVGSNCQIHFTEDIMELEAKYPVSIFDIHMEDNVFDLLQSRWVTKLDLDPDMEGTSFAANDEGEIDRVLLSISEAARLHLKTEPTTSTPSVRPVPMVFVPPGEFIMGTNTVYLDAFWINKTEVTNGMYAQCVQVGACGAPSADYSRTRDSYYGDAQFNQYPVIFVSWVDANNYCAWAGGGLPTEAEWEKAARGTDGRQYPWGDKDPLGSDGLLNYQAQDTTPVGIFPNGTSPYGALDMAGNVSEWVADWLSPDYYNHPPASNPLGPDSGQYRVWRGGSWASASPERIRTYSRTANLPTDASGGIGFRCARDASP